MQAKRTTRDLEWPVLAAIIGLSLAGLFALGTFDPPPERAADTGGVFVYYGPEGETVAVAGLAPEERAAAEAALAGADYFAAYAIGPGGRTGQWAGAWTPALARDHALADCGTGCRVVAERLPLHRDPDRTEPVATTAMARNVAVRWPFTRDYIAIGGAGAWGHRDVSAGGRANRMMQEAVDECEVRRAAEAAPDRALSHPCLVQRLRDFEDLRPEPELYPAPFTDLPTTIVPVSETRVEALETTLRRRFLGSYKPPRLYGARADNGASSSEVVREAGWPEAGAAIALAKCEAQRRPGEPECQLTHQRLPDPAPAGDVLAVTPELFAAYQAWQQTGGAGAFAIGPYGQWGFTYDYADADTAVQKAADWCWYHTRRDWEYRQVDRAFLDPGVPCRIVDVRRQ